MPLEFVKTRLLSNTLLPQPTAKSADAFSSFCCCPTDMRTNFSCVGLFQPEIVS